MGINEALKNFLKKLLSRLTVSAPLRLALQIALESIILLGGNC
jgi:hypothetical protein